MNMVEKVARAICALEIDPGPNLLTGIPRWHQYVPAARAAIEAMRDPTEEMIEAAHRALAADKGDVSDVYRAMIDTALSEPEGVKE